MNKNGFTLIELLCVIVILALITVIASTGIMSMSNNSKENLYCTKIEMIEGIASSYAVKYERELNDSLETYKGYKSLKIKVNELVINGKLEADKDNDVISPLDNSIMNNQDIIIYLKNNNIYAYIENSIC